MNVNKELKFCENSKTIRGGGSGGDDYSRGEGS